MKPHHKPHAPRQAFAWLRTEPGFARLGEQAGRLAALQADLARGVPTLPLTVVAFERDTLVVGAAHAAVAAKVRQMEPTILGALARRGWRIQKIRFKPQWRPEPSRPKRRDQDMPGPEAVAGIEALSEQVEDPRLKAALRRLATRHSPPSARD
jgi:hypothetical protein